MWISSLFDYTIFYSDKYYVLAKYSTLSYDNL